MRGLNGSGSTSERSLRRFRIAFLGLGAVLLIGTAGYVVLEGWSAFDALYMTVITLATIGYQEVRPLTVPGRVFTIGLVVVGVSTTAILAASFAEVRFSEIVNLTVGRRRMQRSLAHLNNHFILCGFGRMGQEIAEQFRRRRSPYVVIELSEEKARLLEQGGHLYVCGDASDDRVLKAAGIERARGLIAVAPNDAVNVFITLSARALRSDLFIVARSVYAHDQHKLEIAGANRVVSPYVMGARRIASAAFFPNVIDFLDLNIHDEDFEWELGDVRIVAHTPFRERKLRESGLRETTGCTVLAVRSAATGRFVSNPDPDTVLHEGDALVVLGTAEQLRKLARWAGSDPEGRAGEAAGGKTVTHG